MFRFFLPDIRIESIYELTGELLSGIGVKVLIADLDNTLAKYETELPTERVAKWVADLIKSGVKVAVVSNNNMSRVEKYCKPLGIDHYWKSGKPSRKTIRSAMEKLGGTRETTALVGDKTVTDIFGAKRCGILAIKVLSKAKRRDDDE